MKLFFRKYGKGQPLIILHGLYGSSDNWVTIAKNISRSFTVYLPDQRNHGNSPHDDIHDYESMSADLLEMLTDLGIKKFTLLGHSMGGKTAMLFAIKWPEMIESLVIADISPFTDERRNKVARDEHLTILNSILSTDLSKVSSRTDAESILSREIHSEKVRVLILKNLIRNTENRFVWKLNAAALKKNLEKILEGLPRPDEGYQEITGFPVIFLKGENSDYITLEDKADIIKLFPSAELRIIKRAGHWIHADNPEAVTEALLELAGH